MNKFYYSNYNLKKDIGSRYAQGGMYIKNRVAKGKNVWIERSREIYIVVYAECRGNEKFGL